METATKDLLRSLKTTAGSRFNASKRLAHVDKRLTALTAFTSALVIASTVLPKFIELPKTGQNWLELTTIALSVLLLASSVLQYASNHAVHSEIMNRSALDLQELKRELQFRDEDLQRDQFLEISKRYNQILQKYSLNHDDVDFWRYQLDYSTEFKLKWFDRVTKRIKIQVAYQYPSIVLFSIVSLLALVMYLSLTWPEPTAQAPPAPPTQSVPGR